MSKTTILALLIGFCMGGVVGYMFSERWAPSLSQTDFKSLLQERLAQGNPLALRTNEMIGNVVSVSDNRLVLDTLGFNQFSIIKDGVERHTVQIPSGTLVVRLNTLPVQQVQEEYQRYQKAYQAYQEILATKNPNDYASLPTPPTPPSTYTETQFSLSDIAPGSMVKVLGQSGILLEENPAASKIILLTPSEASAPASQ